MKKLALLLLTTLLIFTSCKVGSISTSSGLENESFLEFIGATSKYQGGVDVDIDNAISFKAKVYKEKASKADRIKRDVYAISTGAHTVRVSYKGVVIYQKQIFVSAQETKKIILK